MPDDTDGPYDHSPSQERIREINKGLQKLSCYVERKAAQQPENAVVDFVHTEKACRLLFSKYVAAKKSGVSPINALPNLLDVVSNAEAYRLSIAHQADLAVNTWNVYFKSTEPKQALSKQDVEALNGIVESQAQWRKVYLKIVEKAIALDLHCLFVSKPWSLADYMVRLLEYNPSTFEPIYGHQPSPRNFINFLSEEEVQSVRKTCEKNLKMVQDSHKWLQKYYPNNVLNGLYSQEFQDEHPPPANVNRLGDLLYFYLKHISEEYQTLTTIFPLGTGETTL